MFKRLVPAVICIPLMGSATNRAVAAVQDSAGWWIAAAQTDAVNLPDAAERTGTLTTLAFDFAAADNMQAANQVADAALTAAATIKDPMTRLNAILALAGFRDQTDQKLAAFAVMTTAQTNIDALPTGQPKLDSQARFNQYHAVLSGLDEARKPLDNINDASERAQAFGALADAFVRQGKAHVKDFSGAISAATDALSLVKDSTQKEMIKSLIAQTQARGGDEDGAESLAMSVADPAAQGQAFAVLADQYIKTDHLRKAQFAVAHMATDAGSAPDDRRTAIWLDVARERKAMNDKPGALEALTSAASSAVRLEAADRADALSAVSHLRAELGDVTNASQAASDAAAAAQTVSDPSDATEVNMAVSSAQARCGLGSAALQSLGAAQAAGGRIPQDKRHPEGDPSGAEYMEVIQSAADAGDFATANTISQQVGDLHVRHDGALAIAAAQVTLGKYQDAEDTVHKEGSIDSEATVCGIIAASLARTRTPAETDGWVSRLTSSSDRVAARMAVAQVLIEKAKAADAAAAPK